MFVVIGTIENLVLTLWMVVVLSSWSYRKWYGLRIAKGTYAPGSGICTCVKSSGEASSQFEDGLLSSSLGPLILIDVYIFCFFFTSLELHCLLTGYHIALNLGAIRIYGFSGNSVVKNSPANAVDTWDVGSVPGLGRAPGEGNGNPLLYSCLENCMNRGAWQAAVHGITKEVGHDWVNMHTTMIYAVI